MGMGYWLSEEEADRWLTRLAEKYEVTRFVDQPSARGILKLVFLTPDLENDKGAVVHGSDDAVAIVPIVPMPPKLTCRIS